MSMTADLRDRLGAAVAGGRVYRDERPQGSALPAVRLQTVSDPRPSDYEGRIALRETAVQADCMAASRGAADELADAVIATAETAGTFGDTTFTRAFVDSLRTYSEKDAAGKTTFVTSLDLRIWQSPAG